MSGDDENPASRWARRAELMRLAQDGDRVAYRTLLDELGPVLAAFLRRWASDPPDLDDLCQEALLTVHRARHSYDPALPLQPWLFAVARNVATDHLRRRLKRISRELPLEAAPEAAAEEAPRASDLREALSQLPSTQREAFELLKLEGLSVEDGARRAGTTPGALRVRASRAYRALRARLRS